MKHLVQNQDDSGDFSTSFGDMVFGLLFFFFILSLIMVFNRPDVSKFQKEQDHLLKEVNQQKRENVKLQRQINLSDNRIQRLKDEKKELFGEISSTTNELKKKAKEANELDQEKSNLDFRFRKLRDKYYDKPDQSNKLKQLERELYQETENNKSLRGDLKKVKEENEKMSKLFRETEQLLKDQGYRKVLADIDQLKKGQESRTKDSEGPAKGVDTTENGGSETPPPEIVRLYVRLFDDKSYTVIVMSGKSKVLNLRDASEEDLVKLAQEAKEDFDESSKEMTKEEIRKYQPKIFLMTHPDTSYGIVEQFLKKIRKVLPVKILEWKK